MTPREIMLAELPCNIVYGREQAVDGIIAALHAAGFRILGPDEVDAVTVERCAEVAECATLPMSRFGIRRILATAIRALSGDAS